MPQKTSSFSPKFIFVSGGVLSSLGKGITTASIAFLLKARGYRVTVVKCENYLNIDSGLINPIEHGDPFLCEDGTETDMDLGTYEKFLDQNMSKNNFITMGQIYKTVIDRERAFGYNGEDVEMPHVCDEIISRITEAGKNENAEIIITELGGTAGEYLNVLYYEASRILEYRNNEKVIHIHVSYLPTPPHIGEPKTKPTQLSVQRLNSMGIQPDFIVARSETALDERRRERFALFCNVKPDHIIANPDVSSVYEVPLLFANQKFDAKILKSLHLPTKSLKITPWKSMIKSLKAHHPSVKIGVIGKYLATGEYQLRDSYAALYDAIQHAALPVKVTPEIHWINSEKLEKMAGEEIKKVLGELDGIVVPIGWGGRGVEGKIVAIQYAREYKIPYLGLCYGMQLAVVEFARNVLGWKDAQSQEVDPHSQHLVVHMIPAQKRILENRAYGGTMRLGAWECKLKPGTLAHSVYGKDLISERHRHRYEFNDEYAEELEKAGLVISGRSVKENLVEMVELPPSMHPFFIGTQGHPEYKSRPLKPHPMFVAFVEASKKHRSK
ncbi:MAG: CTP synthase [Candidatus Pacebacteria bacterium RIFCSPHIGHO2_01_FULL_46_10]|nr:MAG: CTP synthase [Candidatus Pacebacteria bacterium RIFCSPHIGHO2_01_FULL_46_10]